MRDGVPFVSRRVALIVVAQFVVVKVIVSPQSTAQ